METPYLWYFLMYMIYIWIFQSLVIFVTDLWNWFIKFGIRFMVLFMIWKLHEADFVESFDVIWEEFVEIYFPWLIMLIYKSIHVAKYILIMILYHQMMTIKGPLHMIFVYNTLMHWCMISTSTTSSPSPSPIICSFSSSKWRRGSVEEFFYDLCHVHFLGEVLFHRVFLLTSVIWTNKILL